MQEVDGHILSLQILFSTSLLIDEAVGGNVGGFVMSKRRGEAGRQGGNGEL